MTTIRTPTRSCPRTGWGSTSRPPERAAVDEIGFTDHVFRFTVARDWLDHPLWTADGVNDLAAYHGCVSAARDAGMPVKVGLEVDYLDGREDAIRAALDPFEWDFLLGSVHWIDGLAVDWEAAPIWERHRREGRLGDVRRRAVRSGAERDLRLDGAPRPGQGVREPP